MAEFSQRPPIMGQYLVGNILGKGMQATVRKGKDIHTGEEVALRIVNRRDLTPSKLSKMEKEINIMKIVNHPNIIALKYVEMDMDWTSHDGSLRKVALMVLEVADNGELFDYLMYGGCFSDAIARAYMKQLMSALSACHSNLIYHRDIKPENILLDRNFQLKLADFGLSTISESEDSLLQTDCGTKSYMSPEVAGSQQYRGEDADIWSAAVVMFIMLCGNPPFQIAAKQDWWFNAISLNRHDRFWAAHLRSAPHMATNIAAQNCINKVFLKKPEDRYTLEKFASDAWMTSGVQYTPDQLMFEMSQKKLTVIQGKEREAREAANRARQGGDGQFDPFAASTAYRSVGDETDPSIILPETIPVCQMEKIVQTSFFSAVPAAALLRELRTAACSIDSDAIVTALEAGFGWNVSLKIGGQSFEFEGELIEMPCIPVEFNLNVGVIPSVESGHVYAVELVRTSGDMFSFQQAFRHVKSYIEKFETSSLPDTKENSEKIDAEPALIDNMGII